MDAITPFRSGDRVYITLKGKSEWPAKDGYGLDAQLNPRAFPRSEIDFGAGYREGRVIGHYYIEDELLRTPENEHGISLLSPYRYPVFYQGRIVLLPHTVLMPYAGHGRRWVVSLLLFFWDHATRRIISTLKKGR